MTNEEIANGIANRSFDSVGSRAINANIIQEALDTLEKETIERCAKVAIKCVESPDGKYYGDCLTANGIAQAIRSQGEKEKEK